MPIYEYYSTKDIDKKKKLYWYEVELGKDHTGKRIRKKERGFTRKKDAEAAMIKVMNEYNSTGAYAEPSSMLFRDYIQEWFKNKKNIGGHTYELYESIIRVHLIPSLGGFQISKITALNIQTFLNELSDKGLSPAGVKRIFSVLNASLNAAEKMDIIPRNVASKVEKPKVPRKELKVWDPEYVVQFLDKIKNESRYSIAIYLAVMTGMRQGEILGLRWADIDFESRIVHIQQTLSHDGKTLRPGAKTAGSIRSVAISPETVAALKEHRQFIVEERLQKGEKYLNKDLVICTEKGTPAGSRSILKVWDRLINKFGAPRITFHDLRHTHASLLLKNGIHPKVVSERLGHSSINITLDTYSHLLPNMQDEAAKGLDSLFQKSKENIRKNNG